MLRPLVDMLTKHTSLPALATSLLELNLLLLSILPELAGSVGSDNAVDEEGQHREDKHRGDDDHQADGDGSVSAAHAVSLPRLFLVGPEAEESAGDVSGDILHVEWVERE